MKSFLSGVKGVSGGAVAAIVIVIVIIGAIVFLNPTIIAGGFGGSVAVGSVGPGTQGVVIKNFLKDSATTETGVPVVFTLEIENKGEVDARNVRASFFGLPSSDWKGLDKEFDLDLGDGKLDKADISNNIPGESVTSEIEVEPTANKFTDTTYTVGTRVHYGYETRVEGIIQVASRDYIRSISQTGQQLPAVKISSIKQTAGPLTVAARPTTTTPTSEVSEIRITFDITNTGGGRTYKSSGSNPPTVSTLNKLDVSDGGNIDCSATSTTLINGRTKTMTCKVKVSGVPQEGFVNVPFDFTLSYNYYVDSTTAITLLKTQN